MGNKQLRSLKYLPDIYLLQDLTKLALLLQPETFLQYG